MKKITLTVFTILLSLFVIAQDGNLGLFLGASYYQGEVNPNKVLYMPSPVIGLFYRHNFNNRWAMRIEGNYTVLRGDDAKSNNEYQQWRNYSFKTKLGDIGVGMEFNFLPYEKKQITNLYYTPYVFFGGMLLVIPDPKYPFEFSFPVGLGFKYALTEKITVAVEWNYRWTYSDRLDGIKEDNFYKTPYQVQRSYNPDNDWYSFIGASIAVELFRNKYECPAIFY